MKRVRQIVSVLLVLVILSSVVSPVMAAGVKIQEKQIKINVKKNTKTLTIVQVNNMLISKK